MTNEFAVIETRIYQECPGGDWKLYTSSAKLAASVRRWSDYKSGRIRDYGSYVSIHSARPHAHEFRFDPKLKKRVERAVAKFIEKDRIPRSEVD